MMRDHHQRGITLITALIMLVLLTLLALTSFNLGKSNLLIVANMQQRDEAIAAAREVLEEVISTADFTDDPTKALPVTCGALNERCIDSNGDTVNDIKVALVPTPTCAKVQFIKNSELDINKDEDLRCSNSGAGSGPAGIEGSNLGNSDCANSTWDLTAVATDMLTEAEVTVTQGVSVRLARNTVETNCPLP
jgi:Tfp pilus assembly protein PilX